MRISKQQSLKAKSHHLNGHSGAFESLQFQSSEILEPLRPFIIPTQLVDITSETITQLDLQRRSTLLERPYIPLFTNKTHALILQDLSPTCIASFKPKWLTQSPSAPPNWTRCRTCALCLARQSTGRQTANKDSFCPFDLISSDIQKVRRAAHYILPDKADFLTNILYKHPLLLALHRLQSRPDLDIATLMTLRDCTVYVCIDEGSPRLYVGDLDIKDEQFKASYWHNLESMLIDQGWYEK